MSDIVERLKSRIKWDTCIPAEMIMAEAADEVESLRQRVATLTEERQWLLDDVAKFRGERNALREELAALKSSQQAAHETGQGEPVGYARAYVIEALQKGYGATKINKYPQAEDDIALYTFAPTMLTEQAPCDIPEGYVMVPVKPTPEMIEAGRPMTEGDYSLPFHLWKFMLAAAPKPEE